MEYKIVAVTNNRIPRIVEPIPIKETLVIISCDSTNNCKVHAIKNKPITRKLIPGIP